MRGCCLSLCQNGMCPICTIISIAYLQFVECFAEWRFCADKLHMGTDKRSRVAQGPSFVDPLSPTTGQTLTNAVMPSSMSEVHSTRTIWKTG